MMMKTVVNITLFCCLTLSCFAQFSFETFPKPDLESYNKWEIYDRESTKHKIDFTISIPSFYDNNDTLSIQITNYLYVTLNSNLRIFKNAKEIQKQNIEYLYVLSPNAKPDSVFCGDINGDSLKDIKLYFPNHIAAGSYNSYAQVIYLFQQKDGTFNTFSFSDYFEGFKYRHERDFDHDGNYEIITQTYQKINGHSYWCFNLYNYTTEGLENVNAKSDYPILIQLLNRENFEITKKLTKEEMKEYSDKFPREFIKYD